MQFLEYLTNIYVLPLYAVVIGLVILYVYDRFEKKEYANDVYLRIGALIYLSCLATLYISRLPILHTHSNTNTSNNTDDHSDTLPQPNDLSKHNGGGGSTTFEQFKTGIPTF